MTCLTKTRPLALPPNYASQPVGPLWQTARPAPEKILWAGGKRAWLSTLLMSASIREATMSATASGVAQAAIDVNLAAIFVSLELSRSTWLVTSLSPGGSEKMSKHSVRAGDVASLLNLFTRLQEKAQARTGRAFPIIVIQAAGLDGFWIHGVLEEEGIESH